MSSARPKPDLAQISPERRRKDVHALHPYFGKIDPALARALIDAYSAPNDVVLDPFCGSGTVLVESIIADRRVIGWDSSELAVLISAAKLIGVTPSEIGELKSLGRRIAAYVDSPLFPRSAFDVAPLPKLRRVRNLDYWFAPHALRELATLRQEVLINSALSPAAFILAKIAFSRIIVAASNQQGESTYRRVDKPDKPGRVFDLFLGALQTTITLQQQHTQRIAQSLGSFDRSVHVADSGFGLSLSGRESLVQVVDSREGARGGEKASLVVTSPPYLMSWDYGLYHKFRFFWLGFELDEYEETEIGRHLRRQNDDVPRYIADMTRVFKALKKKLHRKGIVAMINAPSIVHGREVDTNALLRDCAAKAGFEHISTETSLAIPGPHHGMYRSLKARETSTAGAAGKKEHVIVLRAP